MQISWMKGFFALSSVMSALGSAADDKGKISLDKGIAALQVLAPTLGMVMDPKQVQIAQIVINVLAQYGTAAADKKVTVNEALSLIAMICKLKGIDFDQVGFNATTEWAAKSLVDATK